MTQRLAILNVVGLTNDLLAYAPNIATYAATTSIHNLSPPLPAVTSTVQSSILTGSEPSKHGVVANGWHERETCETFFWRQANDLVHSEKIWDKLHSQHSEYTVANLFWWFNMYSEADVCITPRPIYCADGRKIPDVWTTPPELRSNIQKKLGTFPLFDFWGPKAGIRSSAWIANAAKEVESEFSPTVSFVYLPHLDYPLQRVGPQHCSIPNEVRRIDSIVGDLIDFYSARNVDVCILSEYGIEEVHDAVAINRVLREHQLLTVREECNREYVDAGASDAFAVPDHQIAHVYVQNHNQIQEVASILERTAGIEHVYTGKARGELDHPRSGEIVAVSNQGFWFSHDWWSEESKAPDYQATVDIHRKPGYDPRELFLAKGWRGSPLRIALKLLCKKLGKRTLFDVISLDPTRVKGSHGRTPEMGAPHPVLITPQCAKEIPQSLPVAGLQKLFIEWVNSS